MYAPGVRLALVLSLVATGCYHPADKAGCAITCDATKGNCPGELVCGTDNYCHGRGETLTGCVPEVVDALPAPDGFIFYLDAGPDAAPDAAGVTCVHRWTTDFTSDPTQVMGEHWQAVGAAFKPSELQPPRAPTYWETTGSEQLTTSGGLAFATATVVDVHATPLTTSLAIQLNVNATTGGSTQLTVDVRSTGSDQQLTLTNAATGAHLLDITLPDAVHELTLAVKPNGGAINVLVDGVTQYSQPTYALSNGSIVGGVTLSANGMTHWDDADVCAQ